MKSSRKLFAFFLFCILMLVSACSMKRPRTVLSNQKMSEVLYDYHLTKAIISNRNVTNEEERQAYMNDLFRKHGITEAEFDSSLVWFSGNPDELVKLYEQITQRMGRENILLSRRIDERNSLLVAAMDGDSVDIWPERRFWRMTDKSLENLLSFNVKADNYFQHTDTLKWQMDFHFVNGEPRKSEAPLVTLQVWFDKDSMIYVRNSVTANGVQTLALANDTLGKIQNVQGSIYIPRQRTSNNLILVDGITLLRLRSAESKARANMQDTLRRVAAPRTTSDRDNPNVDRSKPLLTKPANVVK